MTARRSEQANQLRQARRESLGTLQPREVRIHQGGKLKGRFIAVNGVFRVEVEPV